MYETQPRERERAIAVAVCTARETEEETREHLDELEYLVETAGATVVEKIYQSRSSPDKATAIGSGKVEELKEIVLLEEASLVIFDNDLTPAQVRNLERALSVKIMDRSGVILDIFAAHARTNEAKTQVELAQMQYLLPRLSKMWSHLSKQFGGIGTKGPGETQLETDRRLVRNRIVQLQAKLEKIGVQKQQQRKGRRTMPRFALVGYTNAGKSTLMNLLTDSKVVVEDKLFATLDTTVRSIELVNGRKSLISDTVGFIRKLPTHLVASFRSTLSEIVEADFLLHVVDVSHPSFADHIQVVNSTLEAIGASGKTSILVCNKVDMLESKEDLYVLLNSTPHSVAISAARGINISTLLNIMTELADRQYEVLTLTVPYDEMHLLSKVYEAGEIIERTDHDDGITLRFKVETGAPLTAELQRRKMTLSRNGAVGRQLA